jgi:transcription initiation factor TFIIIB Brf1 subunit/transcription initiation factor TFIIB
MECPNCGGEMEEIDPGRWVCTQCGQEVGEKDDDDDDD